MSRTLKWILGVLTLLIVVTLLAGAVWVVQNRSPLMNARPRTQRPNLQAKPGAPGLPYDRGRSYAPGGFRGRHLPTPRWSGPGPMMARRAFTPFGIGRFFFGGLFRLFLAVAILAAVALVFYQLGRRASSSSPPHSTAGAAPAQPTSAPSK